MFGVFSHYSTFEVKPTLSPTLYVCGIRPVFSRVLSRMICLHLLSVINFQLILFLILNNMSLPNTSCDSVDCRVEWYEACIAHATELKTSAQGSI